MILKYFLIFSLKSLNLNCNKIDSIRFPTEEPTDKTDLFPALTQLHISENSISDVSFKNIFNI